PEGAARGPAVIALADADQSAADIAGLTGKLPREKQLARNLAAKGYVVFAPFFTQRRAFSEPWTNDRSWLFRLAYQTGHHLLGSEVQQVGAAAEFLRGMGAAKIAVAGSGQGGLAALYAAAGETGLAAAWVGNYFDDRSTLYDEPEDRLVWKLALGYGDAKIAGLAAPCRLILEGGSAGAKREFARVAGGHAVLAAPGEGLRKLDDALGYTARAVEVEGVLAFDPERMGQIANAQFTAWQAWYRNAALEAYAAVQAGWKPDTSSIANYQQWAGPKLEEYQDLIGRFPKAGGPFEARSVKLYDQQELTGYRLSVRLYDGVHAYGILVVPKGIRAGERRPVVFVQHGLKGTPEDALGVVANEAADKVYSRFGLELARRGYVVFAPMISTQDGQQRSGLMRRAQMTGRTPLGIEVAKFGRMIDFLSTLPFVDPARFAFYGLSYGGYTALWTGPGEPRFRVVITSGHFNEWNVKTTDLTQGTSFLFYPAAFDMYNFDLLRRFNHSEIGMLVAPRAFLIEVGDRDGVVVAPRRWPDVEMERVVELYRALGIPERGRIARFDGPHMINGVEAYRFLDRWLER
ncbi:MAG: dienelactone hydrolase family protein, partial [Acidobacteria bacterium]|nr:dienelactone hydrolase family protein [Acidobacteriota bacterium]